jgi:hypothetical protein
VVSAIHHKKKLYCLLPLRAFLWLFVYVASYFVSVVCTAVSLFCQSCKRCMGGPTTREVYPSEVPLCALLPCALVMWSTDVIYHSWLQILTATYSSEASPISVTSSEMHCCAVMIHSE